LSAPRPPRGFRDFPPEVMLLRKSLLSKLENVFQRYGFDPLDTPALEYWETLAGKYGEEAESRLIWRFQDPWSGRWYALRYDLTVPLARFVASRPDLPMPFKRYHIGPVWRHEEPQKGRYREFYQSDADIVGSPHPEADAEIVNLVVDALRELGFQEGFRVRLNDRRLLRGVFEEEIGLDDPIRAYRVIDKLDKIGLEGVREELARILPREKVERVIEIIGVQGRPAEVLGEVEARYGGNESVSQALEHLRAMLDLVNGDDIVVVDLSLVRGLDYYTGPILEVVLDEPRIGSVAGGGRYDNLIGMFTGRSVPATGASIGIERIIDAGLELGVYRLDKYTVTQVQVIVLDRSAFKYAWRVAGEIRKHGYNTRIDLGRASQRVQRRKAKRLGIPVLAFVGREEAEKSTVTLYSPERGERIAVPLQELGAALARLLA